MTATEQALQRAIAGAHSGTADEGARIARSVVDAIRNLRIPGLIMWCQPLKES